MDNLTIIVTTFNRPWIAKRCCQSIAKELPGVKILLVDDGNPPAIKAKPFPEEVEIHRMDFDSGLSVKRNYGVELAETEYVAIFDDDFIFDENQPLTEAVEYLQERPSLDLLTFNLLNDQDQILSYASVFVRRHKTLKRVASPYEQVDKHIPCQCGFNAMVARRDVLLENPWDNQLKLGEHWDFFLRLAQAKKNVALYAEGFIRHQRVTTNPNYVKYRRRLPQFRKLALKKHGLSYYIG